MVQRQDPQIAAQEIWEKKFPGAEILFLAGSVIRGEATPFSDLDLVVVFKALDCAWRESFIWNQWPVEVFAHDPATLDYFFDEVDIKSGVPSLPQMVSEGIEIPSASEFSERLKQKANECLQKGPPHLTPKELDQRRYQISDLIDDLRAPRNKQEAVASGARLYQLLADFRLRSQDKWSATGKTIARVLEKDDPAFFDRFSKAFDALFVSGDTARVIALAEEILAPHGGYLFSGLKLYAPSNWRK